MTFFHLAVSLLMNLARSSGVPGAASAPCRKSISRVAGLARVLRGNAQAGLEDVALWHERDISHSSVERVILPDSTTLIDYLQHVMTRIVRDMRVYPERMRENLELTHGAIFSQPVLNALVESGLARDDAYRVVQRCAQQAWDERRSFRGLIEREPGVVERLGPTRLDELFDYSRFLRNLPAVFERLDELEARLGAVRVA